MYNVTVTINGTSSTNEIKGDSPVKSAFIAGAEIATLLAFRAMGELDVLADLFGSILEELDEVHVSVEA